MKITKNQIKNIISEISSAPRVFRINDVEKLKLAVVDKIVQMMPAEEAASMDDNNLRGLISTVYERYFDPDDEGWDPYPEDVNDIRDNLTIVPNRDDEDYDPDEHDHYRR